MLYKCESDPDNASVDDWIEMCTRESAVLDRLAEARFLNAEQVERCILAGNRMQLAMDWASAYVATTALLKRHREL